MSRLLLAVCLGVTASAAAGSPPAAPAPRPIPVELLVRQLADPDAARRDAAEARLAALSIDPPPGLLAAATSADPALRERAARIVTAMRLNAASARLPRGIRFADRGQVDLFVAATAAWELDAADPRLWEPALDLGRRLIDKADMRGDRKPLDCPSSYPDFAKYVARKHPRFTRVGGAYTRTDPQQETPPVLFRTEGIHAAGVAGATGMIGSLIVSRGSVKTQGTIQSSVVCANGDVTAAGTVLGSVIVCDGDVTVSARDVVQTLVVARGNITVKGAARRAVLVAGGKVSLGDTRPPKLADHFNVIKENERHPLGFITFFELATVGVEVAVAEKSIRVSAVTAGKPCGMAGMKVGDVILKVGDKAPTDAESLRRLLRDALAVGDTAVTLKRGDTTETVKVSLPE